MVGSCHGAKSQIFLETVLPMLPAAAVLFCVLCGIADVRAFLFSSSH